MDITPETTVLDLAIKNVHDCYWNAIAEAIQAAKNFRCEVRGIEMRDTSTRDLLHVCAPEGVHASDFIAANKPMWVAEIEAILAANKPE